MTLGSSRPGLLATSQLAICASNCRQWFRMSAMLPLDVIIHDPKTYWQALVKAARCTALAVAFLLSHRSQFVICHQHTRTVFGHGRQPLPLRSRSRFHRFTSAAPNTSTEPRGSHPADAVPTRILGMDSLRSAPAVAGTPAIADILHRNDRLVCRRDHCGYVVPNTDGVYSADFRTVSQFEIVRVTV